MATLQAAVVPALAALLVAASAQMIAGSYARPEKLDVDGAIQNETRFQEAMSCILGDDDYSLCDDHTVGIKYDGWRLLEEGCSGACRPYEVDTYRFLAYVSHNKTQQWEQILAKFDPEGKYRQSNKQQWTQHGINA